MQDAMLVHMASNAFKKLVSLDLEEKILNGGSLFAIAGLFFPWMTGQWLGGETVSYSGIGFYTSFLGIGVLFLHVYIILITLIPLTGGPVIVRKRNKELARLLASAQAVILTLCMWSVLVSFTFDFSRLEVKFGLYCTLIGCLVSMLYSFLRFQEQRKSQVKELFHHPDDYAEPEPREKVFTHEHPTPPPPPPPPPPSPEEHRLYR